MPQHDYSLSARYYKPWLLWLEPKLLELKNLGPEQVKGLSKEIDGYLESCEGFVWNENTGPFKQRVERVLAFRKVIQSISALYFPLWIMDRFKEAIDQYTRGEWVSSIALCGVIVEFIVDEFFRVPEYKQQIPARDREKGNGIKTNLLVLRTYGIIRPEDYERLDEVRDIRNSYIHIRRKKLPNPELHEREDLIVLIRLCEFFSAPNIDRNYSAYIRYARKYQEKRQES